jgi:hypothetical protein
MVGYNPSSLYYLPYIDEFLDYGVILGIQTKYYYSLPDSLVSLY